MKPKPVYVEQYIISRKEFESIENRMLSLEQQNDELILLLHELTTMYFSSESPNRSYEGAAVRARQLVNNKRIPLIGELSKKTGASEEICERALSETGWDNIDAAVEWLRKDGSRSLALDIRIDGTDS